MDFAKYFTITALIAVSFYMAKSVKIRVSGAEATVGSESPWNPEETAARKQALAVNSVTEESSRKPQSVSRARSHIEELVRLIRLQRLCDLLDSIVREAISKEQQMQAPTRSLHGLSKRLRLPRPR